MIDVRTQILAAVEREVAELRAADDAVSAGLAQRTAHRQAGASVVYSLRLDAGEVAALERRAAVLGMKPTVLARNLLRTGLSRRVDANLHAAVSRLEAAVQELRALVE